MSHCQRLDVSSGLRACPECGYQNGFHLAVHPETTDAYNRTVSLRLVCPSCSATYDVGLRMQLEEEAVAAGSEAT